MIHSWELALNEIFWPLLGFYLGNKRHWSLGVCLAFVGFFLAEYLIFTALTKGWVVR